MTRARAFIAAAALLAPVVGFAQVKKYDLKSGIVTFEKVTKVGSTEIKGKIVTTFDDYGAKERHDTYRDGKLTESFFSDDVQMYRLVPATKTAVVAGKATKGRGVALRTEWSEVPDSDKKSGKVKQLPPMTILGKKCESYQVDTGAAGILTIAGAGKVTLYQRLDTKMGGTSMLDTTTAVSFQENAAIPAGTFAVPGDYKLTK